MIRHETSLHDGIGARIFSTLRKNGLTTTATASPEEHESLTRVRTRVFDTLEHKSIPQQNTILSILRRLIQRL